MMRQHNAENERVKRRYFSYLEEAKRYSEMTVDAVAKALQRRLYLGIYPMLLDNSIP